MRKLWLYLAIGWLLSGCASIFTGGSGTTQVTTDPDGARCTAGGYQVISPGPVTVKHSSAPIQIICKKAGYEDGISNIDSDFNPVAIGNLIFIIPWIVDLATGNAWTHDDNVNVVLEKKTLLSEPAGS